MKSYKDEDYRVWASQLREFEEWATQAARRLNTAAVPLRGAYRTTKQMTLFGPRHKLEKQREVWPLWTRFGHLLALDHGGKVSTPSYIQLWNSKSHGLNLKRVYENAYASNIVAHTRATWGDVIRPMTRAQAATLVHSTGESAKDKLYLDSPPYILHAGKVTPEGWGSLNTYKFLEEGSERQLPLRLWPSETSFRGNQLPAVTHLWKTVSLHELHYFTLIRELDAAVDHLIARIQ